ncbi:MAG: sensor histidine kinase [Cytophagales bacterium]
MMRKCLLAALLTFVAIFVSKAQKCIVLDEIEKEFKIKKEHFYSFIDSSNSLHHFEIEKLEDSLWKLPTSLLANKSEITYWIKFCLENKNSNQEKYVIEVFDWQIQEFELYSQNKSGKYISQKKGSTDGFKQRDYKTFNLIFELDADYEGARTFFVRVKTKRHGSLDFRIRKAAFSTSYAVSEYFFLGVFYGFVLLMLALNIFLWASTRENIYGYYVLFIMSLAFQSSLIDGTGFQYLWNHSPEFVYYSLDLSKLLVLGTFFIYVSEMLKLQFYKFWNIAWLSSLLFYALWHLAYISGWFELKFNGWFLMIPYTSTLAVVFNGVFNKQKDKSYQLFLLGVCCFYLGILFIQLRDMGNTQWLMLYESFEIIANYSVNIAILIELVLFSFALSHRFALQKNAEILANKKLIDELQKNESLKEELNKTLEEKVDLRTKELQEKSSKLEMLFIELENLTSVVAHDLRTPLNRVKGLSELVKLSGDLNDEQHKMLEMIFKTLKESEQLINNILELRISESSSQIEFSNVNVDYLFEKIKLGFFQDLERKKIKLLIENNTGIVFSSNEAILTRVLENLVSNAIKFSKPFTNIFLTARQTDDFVEIKVQDQGLGFDENDLKHVFGKFTKLSSRPTQGESSNGLGLNIVKNLVEKLGGEIKLESEKEKGSVFLLRFFSKFKLNHEN